MKARFLALLALVLGLVSCQQDNVGLDVDLNGEAAVTVSVAIPDMDTRAGGNDSAKGAFGNVDLTNYDVRYILEVYNVDGTPAKERLVNYEDNAMTTAFNLRLIPGRGYRFVVWADFVEQVNVERDPAANYDLHYNTADLKDIQLKNLLWKLSDETRDAYTGYEDVAEFKSTSNITVELKRPLGKLRVVTTDIKDMFNVLPEDIKVVYSSKIYTSFDAYASNVKGKETITHVKEIKISENEYADEWNAGKVKENLTLFADYYFAANEQEPISFTLDVKDNKGGVIPQVVFNTAIPIQRNYLTTVMGPVLTDSSNIKVTVEDAFENGTEWNPEDDKYDVEVISGPYTKTITLKTGNYFFKNVTVTTTTGPAIQIEENAVVTIDVQGILKLVGATDGIAVPNSSKLTINGISETRAEGKFGNLNVVAKGGYGIGGIGADVTIKNTTIDYICGWPVQPLFEQDPSYGKSEPEGFSAIGGAKITLDNVEIKKAEGGSKAAAIGNRYWQSTEINITNSILGDVFGGNASAAIGGSRYSSDATKHSVKINIDGTTIKNAVGGQFAGIGAGYDTHCSANDSNAVNNIVITNSNITVKGGKYGAGIGTGYHSAALTGSIDAASTINATAGESREKYTLAQNIGYGVVDATREFKGTVVTFTVAGETIAHPLYVGYEKKNDGAYFDEANNKYYITNAAGLKWVADVVNATTPYTATIFDEAVVELTNDIDLNNEEWIPIGDDRSQRTEWHGVFDGKGYTVKNVKITKKTDRDDENKSSYGLFGNVKGTVKNLTVENVSISGAPKFIGALIGRLNDGLVENCHVKSSSVECNNWTIGGLVGQLNNGKISGCSVEGTTIKGYAAVGAIAGIALNTGERTIENCSVKNCSIVKNGSFGGDFDKMFGAILGATYSGTLKVNINGCSIEGTTILGEASSTIFGFASEGDQVFVDGVCFTPTSVATSDALTEALANGESVVMTDDIETEAATAAPYGNKYAYKLDGGTLDGNGHELHMECYGDDYGIMTSGGTIKNLTIKEGCRAVMIMYPEQDVILDNVRIGGDGVLYPINTGEAGAEGVNLVVTNSTLAGWTSFSNIESASFTNVKFEQGTYYNDINGRVLKPYVNTTLTDCSFIEHMNLDLSSLTDGHKVTLKNCTVNGQVITASTFTVPSTDAEYDTELFTIDLPSWASSVNDCVIFE